MTLFLTFYGDGPYWDNTVMLPAYPTGYSYLRPFRYRNAWVQTALVERAVERPGSFIGQRAVLAMRFRSPAVLDLLIPIRKVRLAAVKREDDNFVYFILKEFVDLTGVTTLRDLALNVPGDVDSEDGHNRPRLFFDAELPEPRFASSTRDVEMWSALAQLVAAEADLPLAPQAQKSVFLHFQTPVREEPAKVGEIEESFTQGNRFGASLPEASSHELVLLHRIPHLIGTNGSIHPVGATVSGTNFEPAPARLQLSGNYNRHVVTITGRRASAAWESLDIQPDRPSATSVDGEEINLVPVSVPMKITRSITYRAKSRWFPLALLAFALGVNGIVGAWSVVGKHPILWLLIAAASILASGAVLQVRRD